MPGGEDGYGRTPLLRIALTDLAARGRTAVTECADRAKPAVAGLLTGSGRTLALTGTAVALTGAGIGTSVAAASAASAPQASGVVQHVGVTERLDGPRWAALNTGVYSGGAQTREADASGAVAVTAEASATHKAAAHPRAAHKHVARVHVVKRASRPVTWQEIQDRVAKQTFPKASAGALPAADRIQPVSPSGAQTYMAISDAQMANATTIVRQALDLHMGLRSAVIAVATAMQESELQNISYGDRDSEGLFQQRPSCGWGSAAQITDPAYSARAFLSALRTHEDADPGWANQPLWANAQSVQESGFPYAYAKWEAQAAQLVSGITRHMF
jgi:hypothetical protein